jgi:segregation and condensation protein B
MLNDETLKALIEAIIYVAPEPVTLDAILKTLEGEESERVKTVLDELAADFQQARHGIQIRQVAVGYKFSSKPEHHEALRKFVKSLKPPVRLSRPALETMAVVAYRQPVTLPEIEEIRGVDCGGVIHTLMEKKLVVTAGRKNVVGRPILYRTSRDFLVHFGLKDINELPSLKEFEDLAKRALGSEWTNEESAPPAEDVAALSGPAPESDAGSTEDLPEESPEILQEQPAESSTETAGAPCGATEPTRDHAADAANETPAAEPGEGEALSAPPEGEEQA